MGGLMDMYAGPQSGQHACGPISPGQPFAAQVEKLLRPLAGMRVRVSLFSIRIGALGPERTQTLVQLALSHIGLTGSLPNGDTGLLYVGPRPAGRDSDLKLERRITDVMGWAVFYLTEYCTIADVDVEAVHCWLDQIAASDNLVEELTSRLTGCLSGAALRLGAV